MTFIISKLNVRDLKIEILALKSSRESSLSFIFDNIDKTNVHKLFNDRIEVFKTNAGILWSNKSLIYIYEITEYRDAEYKKDEIKKDEYVIEKNKVELIKSKIKK